MKINKETKETCRHHAIEKQVKSLAQIALRTALVEMCGGFFVV